MGRNRNRRGPCLRHDGQQDNNRSAPLRAGGGDASGRVPEAIRQAVSQLRAESSPLSAQWIAPEVEYTVVRITKIRSIVETYGFWRMS